MSAEFGEEEASEWARFEHLGAIEVARLWLADTHVRHGIDDDVADDVGQYAYDIRELKGAGYYTEWLAALVELADGDDEIGAVGAGPVEASLMYDLELAKAVESRVPRTKLQAVLQRVWFDDFSPELKRWAIDVLSDSPEAAEHPPRGLLE